MAERKSRLTLSTCRRHQGCDQPICPEASGFGLKADRSEAGRWSASPLQPPSGEEPVPVR